MPPFQRGRELPISDTVAWVIAFELHGEGIRVSQALSIALLGWASYESFLYGPSRHVEHVWAKIPQFHRKLYFQKNMSGYSIWVFIPIGQYSVPLFQQDRELPIWDPVAWVTTFKLHGEGIQHSQGLSIALQGWALDESFLYGPSRHVEHVRAKIP